MRVFFGFLLPIFFAGCVSRNENVLTIAASANMQYAIEEIRIAFEAETGLKTQVIISSSGKLTSQIMEGAPFDVFISADTLYPHYLYKEGKTVGNPKVYAYGQLIAWSNDQHLSWDEKLFSRERIAIANPALAPYGIAAKQALEGLGQYEQVKDKLVFGESVSQTNQYIVSGSVDFGFTALSVVKSTKMKRVGSWVIVPDELYGKIPQAAVAIDRPNTRQDETKQFLDFLTSDYARSILEKFGYIVKVS
ncbi:MAG: molybdate ABC transporter substrate-binding protein [Cyclobacteriaceae bacterium]